MTLNELQTLLDSGYSGRQLTLLHTDRIDSILRDTFYSECSNSSGYCLIAVGGYGRGELAPFSDIDIMLFARDRDASEGAGEFLYKLWDSKLNIGHSFRTPGDCIREARKDIRTRTSILEHRYIAGNADLYRHFKENVYPEIAFRNQRGFITEKLREIEMRHRKSGGSIFMLEPNIKEGKGGLRDIHTILWLGSVRWRIRHFDELHKVLTPHEFKRLSRAYDLLLKIRFCLHLLSGRRNDTLSFEFHDGVARMLGFKTSRGLLGSERFMRYLYLNASVISDITSHALDICSMPYVHLPAAITKRKITDGFYQSKDRIVSTVDLKDTDRIMEAFYIMARTGKRFSPGLKAEIIKNLFRINKGTRNSRKAIEFFMGIISSNRAYETLKEMHRCGVLGRFIPEFGALSFLVVYEPYHRYTVDEHTLCAIKRLQELRDTRYRNLEHLSSIFRRLRHKEALILSLLLHDIGKRGIRKDSGPVHATGHHESEGYRGMKGIIERFNLDIELRNMIEFLVKNHTLMSSVAFKMETEDPEVIARFADEIVDRERLDAIYLLTYADMASVGPDFWTDWKAYQLRELYETVSKYLDGFSGNGYEHISRMPSIPEDDRAGVRHFLSIMPDRYRLSAPPERKYEDYRLYRDVMERGVVVRVDEGSTGVAEVTVGTWDRAGLFSRIVGAITSMGMNIYRARVYTGTNGLVIDKVQISNWRDLWWDGMAQLLKKNLIESILDSKQTIRGKSEEGRSTLVCERFKPFIELDNETSADSSILEFFAQDRIGLLYDASSLMHNRGVDIISARINTESGLANDVFCIQQNGSKIDGTAAWELLLSLWERLKG